MTQAPTSEARLRRLTVVIPNYNYERYVADAIDSALALDWPDVEVIVVDDGSSDASRAVIEGYGDRIRRCYQANRGQLEACNVGFALSTGDAVLFLDADDVVDPSLVRAVERVWSTGVSKVQFPMRAVDARLKPTGTCFPQFPADPSPADMLAWMQATSTYPTPPGSGNVYSRWFLERILPVNGIWGRSGDSACIAAAPLLGDVVTVPLPLVSYRVHGANDGAMSSLDPLRLGREVHRAIERYRYADMIGRPAGRPVDADAWRISLHTLAYRIPSWRLSRASHPVAGDGRWTLLADLWRAWRTPQGVPAKAAATLAAWGCAVLFAPRPVAARLALWRHVPQSRPKAIGRTLARLRIVRA